MGTARARTTLRTTHRRRCERDGELSRVKAFFKLKRAACDDERSINSSVLCTKGLHVWGIFVRRYVYGMAYAVYLHKA